MSMANGYTYPVQAVAPSNRLQYMGSGVSTERSFIVACAFAQDFALRMLGKLYVPATYTTPQLPAEYPLGTVFDNVNIYTSRVKMRASTFRIEPFSECCFTGVHTIERGDGGDPELTAEIEDPTSLEQMERNFPVTLTDGDLVVGGTCECLCKVTIGYIEQPWDCSYPDVANILANTALSITRDAGYEMFTLPNRNLRWADIVAGNADIMLKGDTYATIMIPVTDITVKWHNVPVAKLCEVEAHLLKFRGCVNKNDFTVLQDCLCNAADNDPGDCPGTGGGTTCDFEPETVLFIDWSEDQTARTRGFYKMDTTTLTLNFKQKRIQKMLGSGVVGWNHLYLDRSDTGAPNEPWQRVKAETSNAGLTDLFKQKLFENIFLTTGPDE